MKKRLLTIVLVVIGMLFVLSSCVQNKKETGKNIEQKGNKIQLWHYHREDDYQCRVIDRVKAYLVDNPIPIEFHIYNEDTISVENYILKRNLASSNGNMIVIDDINLMFDLNESYADYTKLDNYNSLLSGYRDRFCIPIGVSYNAVSLDNDVFKYYDINTPEKQIMTYIDYLHVKQSMKEKGANFKLNYRAFSELIDYYLNENELLFADQNSNIIKNIEEFRKLLKKSVINICEDIQLYPHDPMLTFEEYLNVLTYDSLYDETSKLFLSENVNFTFIVNPYEYENVEGYLNKTFVIHINGAYSSPCFYMNKNITNNKIYDLANLIVSEQSYAKILGNSGMRGFYYAPVFNTNDTKALLQLNDDWEIKDIYVESTKVTGKIINGAFELLVKNDSKSKEIANYYFNNVTTYKNDMKIFIINLLYEIAQELGNESSLEDFDPQNDKINNLINSEIDEFIKNLLIHNS